MQLVGRIVAFVGCLVFVGGTFADYSNGEPFSPYVGSLWQLSRRLDIVVAAACATVAVLLLTAFFAAPRLLASVAAAVSGAALAWAIPVDASVAAWGPGVWIMGAGGVAMLVGSVLAATGPSDRGAAAASIPVSSVGSPGWYPDPGGSGRQRYWSGQTWSAETR